MSLRLLRLCIVSTLLVVSLVAFSQPAQAQSLDTASGHHCGGCGKNTTAGLVRALSHVAPSGATVGVLHDETLYVSTSERKIMVLFVPQDTDLRGVAKWLQVIGSENAYGALLVQRELTPATENHVVIFNDIPRPVERVQWNGRCNNDQLREALNHMLFAPAPA